MSFEPLRAGYLLDQRYRIEKVLGEGGMGRVYLGHDTRLSDRPVAIKEMHVGDGLQERKAVEDFNRERDILARLSHPGIPGIIDYIALEGRHYLVMEFIAGGDLQARLDKLGPKGRMAESVVLPWARQILDVLAFLHAQNPPIIYRDLKPANIMIDESGRAMLIDFGIARFLPPGGRGTQIGSVGYAPPEQYLGKLEPRSDLYALAATMHHLLTGRDPQMEPPFSFPPVRQLAPEVSVQTEQVIMQALDKDIAKRPASAQAMLAALPDPRSGVEVARRSAPLLALTNTSPASSTPPGQTSTQRSPVAGGPAGGASITARSPTKIVTSQARPTPAPPQVSSTAKTQELPRLDGVKPASVRPAPPQQHPAPRPLTRAKQTGSSARVPSAPPVSYASQAASPPATARPMPNRTASSASAAWGPVGAKPVTGHARLIAQGEAIEFVLHGDSAIIGRRSGAADHVDIDLSQLKRRTDLISRHHAEVIRNGSDYYIRDLGSRNGTYLIGKGRLGRDQLYKLNDRDKIAFADAAFEFRKG
jgi:serine/threonine protein kinase